MAYISLSTGDADLEAKPLESRSIRPSGWRRNKERELVLFSVQCRTCQADIHAEDDDTDDENVNDETQLFLGSRQPSQDCQSLRSVSLYDSGSEDGGSEASSAWSQAPSRFRRVGTPCLAVALLVAALPLGGLEFFPGAFGTTGASHGRANASISRSHDTPSPPPTVFAVPRRMLLEQPEFVELVVSKVQVLHSNKSKDWLRPCIDVICKGFADIFNMYLEPRSREALYSIHLTDVQWADLSKLLQAGMDPRVMQLGLDSFDVIREQLFTGPEGIDGSLRRFLHSRFAEISILRDQLIPDSMTRLVEEWIVNNYSQNSTNGFRPDPPGAGLWRGLLHERVLAWMSNGTAAGGGSREVGPESDPRRLFLDAITHAVSDVADTATSTVSDPSALAGAAMAASPAGQAASLAGAAGAGVPDPSALAGAAMSASPAGQAASLAGAAGAAGAGASASAGAAGAGAVTPAGETNEAGDWLHPELATWQEAFGIVSVSMVAVFELLFSIEYFDSNFVLPWWAWLLITIPSQGGAIATCFFGFSLWCKIILGVLGVHQIEIALGLLIQGVQPSIH